MGLQWRPALTERQQLLQEIIDQVKAGQSGVSIALRPDPRSNRRTLIQFLLSLSEDQKSRREACEPVVLLVEG
jgi:hypothetical protein